MNELKKSEYEKARPVFKELSKYHLMIDSVLDGNTPRRVYDDDIDDPSTAFSWNQILDSGWFLESMKKEEGLTSLHDLEGWNALKKRIE
ncbi:MAG: hypothetical protein ACXAEU_18155 [Candidatus Hodarchaeales archaeon]